MQKVIKTHESRGNLTLSEEILAYNRAQLPEDRKICSILSQEICRHLPESEHKIWHSHPVWFLDANPIVGYSKQKKGIRLMFWSGADFGEPLLSVLGEKFKDASAFFTQAKDIPIEDLARCLELSKEIQWDYKNLIKRKGKLERL